MADSDCVVVMGSNMAECHPVAFRWPMLAKARGAKLIHVDPRFTRTSAMADIHAAIRAGSDMAFLGGLVTYVINSRRWNTDPFFKSFVVNYTNAATIVSADYKDTEDLDGVFSGLKEYQEKIKEWPLNAFLGQYDNKTWQYAAPGGEAGAGWKAPAQQSGEHKAADENVGAPATSQKPTLPPGPPFEPLVKSLLKPPPPRDDTLQDPRCVFQIVKRHFARYTPELVERVTGCPKETFQKVAETLLNASGADKTSSFAYAVAWTQHTNGPQIIGCAALLQLLLGNVGRPGAGIMALRGHASIQGSTDIPTLYHSIHGYMSHPSALKTHGTLAEWLAAESSARGYWANTPKFMVSYLKSMYGAAATKDNDFGYDWHPKILGDHSHLPMFVAMNDGRVKGMLCIGQNPATSLNALLERRGMAKLEWLVVKDNWVTESATFWQSAPEVKSGKVKPGDLKDDGSTTGASWIYCGVFPAPGQNRAASRKADPPGTPGAQLGWAWAWPANRRIMYNRASADPSGRPWSERKKWVWWDEAQKKWVGLDVPDFAATKPPSAKARPDAIGLDALAGTDPFIMKTDGRGWLFVPTGLVDGPLPAHYEPAESPVKNPLYKQQSSPVYKYWKRDDNALAAPGDSRFPIVITTYRLTEHYLAGAMSRWNPWLTELQPELFIEMSPELAAEKGIANLGWVRITTPRGNVRAKALVTRRLRPFTIDGRVVHHVGMPWHWGYEGVVTGDIVNELTSLVGDPNVSIHEGKAFVCNVEKA